MSVDYKRLAKPDTFLGQYMDYMSAQETALAYDFYTALWLISVAVGRGCIVARPRAPVYLNMYLILVAESGITRKSSEIRAATELARNLINERDSGLGVHVELVQTKITPELLTVRLHEQTQAYGSAHAVLSISELANSLGRGASVSAMPIMLTDLYDCPTYHVGGGTVGGGMLSLRNVWINLLAGSTPNWLARAVSPHVVEGGFTSRCFFVHAERPKRSVSWPEESDDDGRYERIRTLSNKLQGFGRTCSSIPSINATSAAKEVFKTWYETRNVSTDPFRSTFASREDGHILRVAALLSINRGAWEVQENDILNAIAIVTELREMGAALFSGNARQVAPIVRAIDRLRTRLAEAGRDGLRQSDCTLLVRSYITGAQCRDVLNTMLELDMVQCFEIPNPDGGPTVTLWRATRLITSKDVMSVVYAKHAGEVPNEPSE